MDFHLQDIIGVGANGLKSVGDVAKALACLCGMIISTHKLAGAVDGNLAGDRGKACTWWGDRNLSCQIGKGIGQRGEGSSFS